MSWFGRLFGPRERPEETLRFTRMAVDLLAEGKSDDDVERALVREGAPVERARAIVREVRKVSSRLRAPG